HRGAGTRAGAGPPGKRGLRWRADPGAHAPCAVGHAHGKLLGHGACHCWRARAGLGNQNLKRNCSQADYTIRMTKRIGIHLGTAGGPTTAVERAHEIGANTFQIFSSSPRMWRAPKIDPKQAERMKELRAALDVGPLVIHTSYLVNVCSQSDEVREKSVGAFRGEIERALALGAEYL